MGETAALFPVKPARAGRPTSRVQPAVKAALASADHLTPSDDAVKSLALRIAADLDRCPLGDKLAATFQAQLLGVLKEAGLTPRARRLADLDGSEDASGGDLLDQLSAIRASRRSAAVDPGAGS